MSAYVNPVINDMFRLGKPIIGAVNGVAAGAGVGIALSCDIVFAAKSATFIQVFGPQLGLITRYGMHLAFASSHRTGPFPWFDADG